MCAHLLNIDMLNKCANIYKSIPIWVFTSILCFCLTISVCTNVAQYQLVKEQNVAIEEILIINKNVSDQLDNALVIVDRYQYGFVFLNTALGIPIEQAERGLNEILKHRHEK